MEYTHEFATKAAFIEQYLGENYKTHWVSLTTSDNSVNYDKDLEELPLITYPTVAGASTFTMSIPAAVTTDYLTSISYSIDGGATWTTTNNSSSAVSISVALTEQKPVLWKGVGTATAASTSAYSKINCNKNFIAFGNPLSLLGLNYRTKDISKNEYALFGLFYSSTTLTNAGDLKLLPTTLGKYCYGYMFYGCSNLLTYPTLPATILGEYCYAYMFSGCSKMTTPPTLASTKLRAYCYYYMFNGCSGLTSIGSLPATNLWPYCYADMFKGCTGLTNPTIVLPATAMSDHCYIDMFNGCTNLTTVPTLPSTSLSSYCYAGMFSGCTNLPSAPVLPATMLEVYCYYQMFNGCTNLNEITVLFETNPATSNNTTGWVTGVAASGTFNMSSTAAWDPDNYRGVNGVPTNWTVNTITPTLVTRDGGTSYIVPNNGLTFGLGGFDLLQNPTITISDPDEVFNIELDEDSSNEWDDWVNYSEPYSKGNLYIATCSDYETLHTATITLFSPGATNLVITLTNLQIE